MMRFQRTAGCAAFVARFLGGAGARRREGRFAGATEARTGCFGDWVSPRLYDTGRLSAMDPKRWEKIRRLQETAREKLSDERRAFLDSACAGDEALRHEIETLLASETGSFVQTLVGVGTQLGPYKLD